MNNQERYNQEIDEMLLQANKITLLELQDNIDTIIGAACELDELTRNQSAVNALEINTLALKIHASASTLQDAFDRLHHK